MNFSAPPRRKVDSVSVTFGKPPRGPTVTGWSKSTQTSRVAVAPPPPQVKPFDEEYPVLGVAGAGAGSSTAAEKCVVAKKNSYATLAASWAKTEEEKKLEEAKMHEELERQRREEYEIAKRHCRAHLQSSQQQQNYAYENEDIDEEFDSGDTYTKPNYLRSERRSTARYEEDEDYEDGDEEYTGLN